MNRPIRIAMEVLFPPGIAAIYVVGNYAFYHPIKEALNHAPITFLVAYAAGSIPSIVYAALMEGGIALGLDPRKKKIILASAAFGAVIGFTFSALLGSNELWVRTTSGDIELASLGSLSGVAIASIIHYIEVRYVEMKNA